jgi:hypothetical protein
MTQSEADLLGQTIENLAYKKKHALSEDALKAKESFSQQHEDAFGAQSKWWARRMALIEEFSSSVRLLVSVFQASAFDELALFISNPTRILFINFCIGILRGLGFGIGLLCVFGLGIYLFQGLTAPVFQALAAVMTR